MEGEEKKLSEHEFVIRAIKKLRKPPYKGIHSVYSGFNRAFKDYFNASPVKVYVVRPICDCRRRDNAVFDRHEESAGRP
jgi:hypothetical protein